VKEKNITKKEKYISIAIGTFVTVWILMFITSWLYGSYEVGIVKGQGVISKVEMKVVSPAGVKQIVITDRTQLQQIDNAFKNAKEIDRQAGKIHTIWADINLEKGGKKVNVWISYNDSNGWVMDIHNNTFSSNFLFKLVQLYSEK
jgi:hypothetical protein